MEKDIAKILITDLKDIRFKIAMRNDKLKKNINPNYETAKNEIKYVEFYEEFYDDLTYLIERIKERVETIEVNYDNN